MNTAQLIASDDLSQASLHLAIAAYLARFNAQSRVHTDSDLRAFLRLRPVIQTGATVMDTLFGEDSLTGGHDA